MSFSHEPQCAVSALTSRSAYLSQGSSRLEQLVSWCGPDFDGLIVYDECHKVRLLPVAALDQRRLPQFCICYVLVSMSLVIFKTSNPGRQ